MIAPDQLVDRDPARNVADAWDERDENEREAEQAHDRDDQDVGAHLIPDRYGEDVPAGSRGGRSERLIPPMTLALSLFAIGLGAILKFAVTTTVGGINIATVGVILMVIGAVGLAIGLWLAATGRSSADQPM